MYNLLKMRTVKSFFFIFAIVFSTRELFCFHSMPLLVQESNKVFTEDSYGPSLPSPYGSGPSPAEILDEDTHEEAHPAREYAFIHNAQNVSFTPFDPNKPLIPDLASQIPPPRMA